MSDANSIEYVLRTQLAAAGRRAEQAERDRDQAIALLRQVRDEAVCPYPCDGDCGEACHSVHQVFQHRSHQPVACPSRIGTLIDSSRLLDPAQPTQKGDRMSDLTDEQPR
jgi:hypothetical protein